MITLPVCGHSDHTDAPSMKRLSARLASSIVVLLTAALAGCGGSTGPSYTVLTAGDSLSDTGTFGYRFTVQGTSAAPNLIWTERVAAAISLVSPCPRYQASADGTVISANPSAAQCGGYAVGGAQINVPDLSSPGGDATPWSVLQQIRTLARERKPLLDRDIILIGGGGNDAATVFGLWLRWQDAVARGDATAPNLLAAYKALMTELLGNDPRIAAAGTPQELAVIGTDYMAQLARVLANEIKLELLQNSAKRVVVANIPDISQTPRLVAVLAPLKQLIDQTAYLAAQAFAQGLTQNYNSRLVTEFAGESRVAIFNLNQNLNAWVTQPPASLTNVTTPACPSTGNSGGIPTYSVKDCTAAGLSAQAVGAQSPNWWESYLFSDDFHPSPRGHQLAADALIRDVLRDRGWN